MSSDHGGIKLKMLNNKRHRQTSKYFKIKEYISK